MDENPNDTNAPKLLDAASAMIRDGKADSSKQSEVVEAACSIWPHHQTQALAVFESLEQIPNSANVRSLMDSVNYEDNESRGNLEKAWLRFASNLADNEIIEIAKLILGKKPKGSVEEPDAALRLWIDVQAAKSKVLSSLLTSESLNDSQRRRVWLQVDSHASKLGKDFFLAELPKIFALAESAETVNAVFESESVFSELFKSTSEKYELATGLVDSFLASSSVETKNRLAQWLRKIDQASALKELKGKEGLGDDDFGILLQQFPNSKVLKQIQQSRAGEDSS